MDRLHACSIILDRIVDLLEESELLRGKVTKSRAYISKESGKVQVMSNNFEKIGEDSACCTGAYYVDILSSVAGGGEHIDDLALAIDAAIYGQLMADETLGLEFVEFTDHAGWTMESAAEGETVTGSGVSRFRTQFTYHRRSIEVQT